MLDLVIWLLVIELMGLVAFPLAFVLFGGLPDRGYALTKPLALLLAAWLLWTLGLTRLIPNSPATIAGILLLGAAVFGWLYYRRWPELERFVTTQWRVIAVAEGVFLVLFLAWCAVLSEFPGINHTEKPMDFAFLNSILQSRFFPPEDPWLAGHSISYYYFGHFIVALPMQLTGIASSVGYNLALALVPALTGMAAFGLTYNLIHLAGGGGKAAVGFGLAAPFLITVTGNLEGALEFIQLRGWGGDGFWEWVGIKGLEGGGSGGSGIFPEDNWWWWRATRVIDTLEAGQSLDYTITEFPFFSFLLGDLHPHVLNLPFLLLVLSLGLNLYATPESLEPIESTATKKPAQSPEATGTKAPARPGPGWLLRHPWQAGAIALSLGALAFINSWDFPVYAAVFGALLLAKSYSGQLTEPGRKGRRPDNERSAILGRALWNAGLMLAPLLLAAALLFLPFYLTLNTQVSGVLPTLGPGTRPFLFFLVMGLPCWLGLGLLLHQLAGLPRPGPAEGPALLLVLAVTLTPLLLWIFLALTWGALTQDLEPVAARVAGRILTTLPGLAVAALAGFCALHRAGHNREAILAFPLLLLAAAAYLLAGTELFRLADFFGNRMNTVFKVYYQAWLLLGIAGSFGLYYCYSRRAALTKWGRLGHYAWAGVAALLLVVALYYPLGAVLDRTGLLREHHTWRDNTLDGLAYIAPQHPAEYAAIEWLRDEAEAGRIVEAVGDDYSDYGRISAATGRPTVLGWKGHEHQWRGTTAIFAGREEAVAQIYQSDDPETVRQLLADYNIRYVYLGHRERAKYGIRQLPNRGGLLKTAFAQNGVIIYERAADFLPDE